MAIFSPSVVRRSEIAGQQGKVLTLMRYDEGEDLVIRTRLQDVSPILELNKQDMIHSDCWNERRDMRLVARIPKIVAEIWMQEGVNIFDENCMPEIERRLNDPENAFLRTCPGRV